MEKTELKKGDKLYSRDYWDDGSSEWRTYTILYIKRNRIKFYGGYEWTINVDEVGKEYFKTKKELIESKLKLLRETLKDEISGLTGEIRLLERHLTKLEQEKIPVSSPTLKRGVSTGAN